MNCIFESLIEWVTDTIGEDRIGRTDRWDPPVRLALTTQYIGLIIIGCD